MSDNISKTGGFYLGDDNANASQGTNSHDDNHHHQVGVGGPLKTKDFDWEGEGTWQATQFDENGNHVGYVDAFQGPNDFADDDDDDSYHQVGVGGPWTTKDFDWEGEGNWQATQFDENGNNVGSIPISIDQLDFEEDVERSWQQATPTNCDADAKSVELVKFFDPEENNNQEEGEAAAAAAASNEQQQEQKEEEHEITILLDDDEENKGGIFTPAAAPTAPQQESPILFYDEQNDRVIEVFKSTWQMRYWDIQTTEYVDCTNEYVGCLSEVQGFFS